MPAFSRSANNLITSWRRYDWRESFFAPGLAVLQALTADGRTASGAGRTRNVAFVRCLGETAEIAALAQGLAAEFQPLSDGLAAHPDAARARLAALCEAHERRDIALWWHGEKPASLVDAGWLDATGVTARLAELRHGASLSRSSTFWWLPHSTGPAVMICQSASIEGQDPILGFGADSNPARAAAKAMREMLLMEMNLMEVMASRTTGAPCGSMSDQLAEYARQCPRLLRQGPAVVPQGLSGAATGTETISLGMRVQDITPPDGPITVWWCQPSDHPVPETPGSGTPFFRGEQP